jgi:preprotein translocase subunit YajC
MTQFLLGQAQQGEAPAGPMGGAMTPFYLVALMVLFFVIVVLPAQKRAKKEHENKIATLKRGAKVVTRGGIVGLIISAKDGEEEVVIRSEETRIRIKRHAIEMVLGVDEAEANKG